MKYELRTQLSLEECVQILHEKSRFNLGLPFRSDSNPFLGQVGPQGVSLYLARSHKNPLAPRFNGTFKKTAIGTILQGEITSFDVPKKRVILLAVLLGFAACCIATSPSVIIFLAADILPDNPIDSISNLVTIFLFPLLVLLFFVLVIFVMSYLGSLPDRKTILRHLSGLLKAEVREII